MNQFVNRDAELTRLRALYDSNDAELAVVSGRRRIGKSTLVLESIRDRNDAVYYQAVQETPSVQRNRLVDAAESTFPGIADIRREWEPLLEYLMGQNGILVIDEFPYLVETDSSLPSIIQRLWDLDVEESQETLVLTGSAIGMIHEHMLAGGAPLYGRISQTPNGRFKLGQLPFASVREFVPDYTREELVFVYRVFGGHLGISALYEAMLCGDEVRHIRPVLRFRKVERPILLQINCDLRVCMVPPCYCFRWYRNHLVVR